MTLPLGIFLYITIGIACYLLGSISSSIILGKAIYGIDVREHGSCNPGATNTQRVLGWRMGLFVLFFDMFKGIAAASVVYLLPFKSYTEGFVSTQILFGLIAMMGHIFPIFHNFKGGKGVATLCGVLLMLHPYCFLICFAIFCIVLTITRYVSVSVITAVSCFPFFVNFIFAMLLNPKETDTIRIFSIIAAIIIWLCHISNLKRLWKGTEPKLIFKKKPLVEQ